MPTTDEEIDALRAQPDAAVQSAPDDPDAEIKALREQDDNEFDDEVGQAFTASLKGQTDRKVGVLKLSQQLGVPTDIVETNYDNLSNTYQASQFDARKWREQNPQLAELIRKNRPVGELVMKEESAWRQVFHGIGLGFSTAGSLAHAYWFGGKGELGRTAKQFAEKVEEGPKSQAVLVDPTAQGSTVEKASAAFRHSQAQLRYSELGFRALMGDNSYELQKRIVDMERELVPRDYGTTGIFEQIAVDAAEIAPSSLQSIEAGGAGFVLGGGFIGAATLAATRSPMLARKAAMTAGGITSRGASAAASFELEAGGAYLQFLKEKTDDGKPIDPAVAREMAILYGGLAAGVEAITFGVEASAFGPLGDAVREGNTKAFIRNALKNPSFRTLARDVAKRVTKGAVGEAGEEAAQQVLQDASGWASRSLSAGKAQKMDFAELAANAGEAGAKAMSGTFGLAPVHGTVNVATQWAGARIERAGSERNIRRAQAVIKGLATSKAAEAAPHVVAQLIEQESAKSGQPITSIYVDPSQVQRFFQENQPEGQPGLVELLGEDGQRRFQEAITTGEKFEIPLVEYAEKWARHPVNASLAEHVTLKATAPSAAELAQSDAETERQAQEIVKQLDAGDTSAVSAAEQRIADQLEADLVTTGTHDEKSARVAVAPMRHFIRTQEAKLGPAEADKFFADYEVRVRTPSDANEPSGGAPPVGGPNEFGFGANVGPAANVATGPEVASLGEAPAMQAEAAPSEAEPSALLEEAKTLISRMRPENGDIATAFLEYSQGQRDERPNIDADMERKLARYGIVDPKGYPFDESGYSLERPITTRKKLNEEPENLKQDRLQRQGADTGYGGKYYQGVPGLLDKLDHDVKVTVLTGAEMSQAELEPMAARKAAPKTVPRGKVANKDQGWGIAISREGIEKTATEPTRANMLALNKALPALIEHAVLADSSKETKGRRHLAEHHTLYAPLAIGDQLYRVRLTIREYAQGGRHFHKLVAAEMESPASIRVESSGVAPQISQSRPPGTLKVRQLLEGVKGSDRKLLIPQASERLSQGDPANARGYVDIARRGSKAVFSIYLNPNANRSTFLHETGHVFLEMLGDLSERDEAPASVKDDYQTLLKWFRVESRNDIATEHHEKFARGFEAYLFEGKAPSSELAKIFQRMKLWLKSIYRAIGSLNVELNDEVRGVFDRLLATDEEIARTQQRMGLRPMFRSPDEAGMTPEAWQSYLEAQEQAVTQASRMADLRVLKDKLRETEKWWKEEEKTHFSKALEEYGRRPDVRAYEYLRTGKIEWESDEGVTRSVSLSGPQKLDRAAVSDLLRGKMEGLGGVLLEGGTHPDDVAELFGFPTGTELLEALVARPQEPNAWAKEQAAARMQELHPDILNERQELEELVGKGLHGDYTSEWLLKEWKALRSKANHKGSPPVEAIKRAAVIMVGRRKLNAIDVGRSLQAERSAAEKAAIAAAKGNYPQAYVYKQQQLLNHYMYRELSGAREDRDAFEELASDLSKDKARAKLGKASPAYRDGVDTILEALGFKEPEQRDQPAASLPEVTQAMEANGETVAFDTELLGRILAKPQPFKSLTVDEMREVMGALKNIKQAATNRNTVLIDGKRRDKEEVIAELLREAAENLPDKGPAPSSVAAMSAIENGVAAVSAIDGELLRPETMLGWLGGGLESTWFRAVFKPLNDGKHRESDTLRKTVKPVMDAFALMPKEVRRRMNESVDGAGLFPAHREDLQAPTRRFELLAMALNVGNPSNMQRLTEGRNITEQEVRTAIDLLSKEEMDWVQGILDACESLWPDSAALEERDSGLRPKKIQAQPIVTRHGTYKGGYFPAVGDRRVEQIGERQAANVVAALMDPSFARPGTSRSHLKSRSQGAAYALTLDLSVVQSHLAQAAHDIAFREAVKSVGGLIMDERVQAELKRRLGDGRARVFLQWVKDVGQMRGAETLTHATELNRKLNAGKSRMGPAILGYAVDVVMGDLSNPFIAVAATDLKIKHLVAGTKEFMRSPRKTLSFVHEKSGEMRFRDNAFASEFASKMKSLTKPSSAAGEILDAYSAHAFQVFEWSEKFSTTGVWVGAYRQALQAEKSDADAVEFADQVVRKIVPASSAIDKPEVLRSKGPLAALLMFHGYMSTVYNLKRDALNPIFVGLAQGKTAGEKLGNVARVGPEAAARYLGIAIGVALLSEFLAGKGPQPDDGEDDAERWATWAKRKLLMDILQPVPLAGEIGEGVSAAVEGKQASTRAAPGVAIFGEMLKLLKKAHDGDLEAWDRWLALAKAAGISRGLPVNRPGRMADYLHDVATGEQQPSDPLDFASGLIYGARENQPANPLSLGSDLISQ